MNVCPPPDPRRVELILRQIDALPTLPVIATRLLELTASEDAQIRQIIELISADPPLTAKVLSMCRTAEKGLGDQALTVDRAVALLGFASIRNAVLSVKVFETLTPDLQDGRRQSDAADGGGEQRVGAEGEVFDPLAFWTHSLAVGILAQALAGAAPDDGNFDAGQAFVCGLLHDIGKLALHHVLPRSFARVVELTELNQGNIAAYERRIIGIDHHTAGKRLAEQWRLPYPVQDCIWLHGSSYETLPRLKHQRLVGVIALADLLARQQHAGYSGNHLPTRQVQALMEQVGVERGTVDMAVARLHEQLEKRGKALGLHDEPSQALLLRSIQRANQALGQLNAVLERRGRTVASQGRVLEAITAFHASAQPRQGIQDVLARAVESARRVLGPGFYAVLYPTRPRGDEPATWLISQYDDQAQPTHAQYVEPPPHAPDLRRLNAASDGAVGVDLMGVLPWIADYLAGAADLRRVRLLPLSCGWETAALLLHDRPTPEPWSQFRPLVDTWGAAIAGAARHEGARRLGEDLAQTNAALAEAQDRLLRQESMARLGEMAAGAAHEMNNPLAIISGRSQMLASSLARGGGDHKAAMAIGRAAHRLSDLITGLKMFADPPRANRRPVDLAALLDQTVKHVAADHLSAEEAGLFTLQLRPADADGWRVNVDAQMLGAALTELLVNALQAQGRRQVRVVAQMAPTDQALLIQVNDDGDGMTPHTLAHATDPFFSAKPAGRQAGMGLPRAQQWVAAHGGEIVLRSTPGDGTTAILSIPLDSPAHRADTSHQSGSRSAA